MAKTNKKRLDEMRATSERWAAAAASRAVDEGKLYCAVNNGYRNYFATLAEAAASRDAFVKEYERPIPADYYDSEGGVDTFDAWIEHHDGARWALVSESKKTFVWQVRMYGRKD